MNLNNPGAIILAIAVVAIAGLILWSGFSKLFRRRPKEGPSYARALEAMAIGDARSAVRHLREAVDENTDNVGAYLHLGRLLRLRGEHDRALRIHHELMIRNMKGEVRRRVVSELIEDYVSAGRWQEAKKTAQSLKGLGPSDSATLRTLGKIHENLREWDEAFAVFEELEKRKPSPSRRRLALYQAFIGLDYLKRSKIKEAKRHFGSALKLEPSLPGALLHLGEIHKQEGDLPKAIETWKTLIRQNPNAVSFVFDRLEKATYEKDPAQITELAADYERILAESPKDVSTMRALASLYHRRGEVAEALRLLAHALEVQPDNRYLRLERAKMLMESGQREDAYKETLEILGARSPGDPQRFVCAECGYRSEEYLWRCPSCHHWESFGE